ncbi:hypothetical protein LOAG_11391 [Loa loa]|uniref:Uncharacterized protein n=1 Tax=Loa loa TaxID=7209 RepID=A0A1I7VVE2_LOALO|nr:hypothetical protein LOAG_11391 [Loa loa]EFO17109.2 hypothetical protein LOAG_11391 [Loa loa]
MMIAQKLAQLKESTSRWRSQQSCEVLVPETHGILSQRKSALLEKQDVSHLCTLSVKTQLGNSH